MENNFYPQDNKFRYAQVEVAGALGDETKINKDTFPPIVTKLHYIFDGWCGNDIIESFPCYIVSDLLKNELIKNSITGIVFDKVKVSKSRNFHEIFTNIKLPEFHWLKITGIVGIDDFGLSSDYRLVISSKVFEILQNFNISEIDFEDFK